jgi:uncharacterized membrane protein
MWKFYAVLSALFAAATAILAKVGLKEPDIFRFIGIGNRLILDFLF